MLQLETQKELKWKRILLIKPNYSSYGWDFYNVNFPPINLTSIAAYLTDLSIEVKILDAKVQNLNNIQIRKKIIRFKPDLVGVSVFVSASIENCNEIAKIVKKINKNCIVVYGGRHPTFLPEETLTYDDIDIIVRGEGELTFRELIIKGSPKNIKGISYKSNGKMIHNPDRPLMSKKQYEKIRIPARYLIENNKYKMLTVRLETIETSRGCPFSCKFCTTWKINNRMWRSRPVNKIISELKTISSNKKITDIFFVDDNLTANTKRIEILCDRIIKCKKNKTMNDFKFFAQLRVDDIVRAPLMVKKMAKAGFWVVFIGIESVNEETLKDVRKQQSFKKVLQALKILHQNNIIVIGNLIIGLDLNESENDIINEIKFMKNVDIDIVTFVLLTPFPGSDSLQELDSAGLIITKDWSKYNVLEPVIKTYTLKPNQLKNLLFYSFKELKYVINKKGLLNRAYKARGLLFFLKPQRIISFISSFLNFRIMYQNS